MAIYGANQQKELEKIIENMNIESPFIDETIKRLNDFLTSPSTNVESLNLSKKIQEKSIVEHIGYAANDDLDKLYLALVKLYNEGAVLPQAMEYILLKAAVMAEDQTMVKDTLTSKTARDDIAREMREFFSCSVLNLAARGNLDIFRLLTTEAIFKEFLADSRHDGFIQVLVEAIKAGKDKIVDDLLKIENVRKQICTRGNWAVHIAGQYEGRNGEAGKRIFAQIRPVHVVQSKINEERQQELLEQHMRKQVALSAITKPVSDPIAEAKTDAPAPPLLVSKQAQAAVQPPNQGAKRKRVEVELSSDEELELVVVQRRKKTTPQ